MTKQNEKTITLNLLLEFINNEYNLEQQKIDLIFKMIKNQEMRNKNVK